jgi:two-component system, NarL family, sensor histidine kinase DegS
LDPDAGGLIRPVSAKQAADPPALDQDQRDLSTRIASDIGMLEAELAEIDMLVAQARSEAERHELKRSQTAAKLAALPVGSPADDVIALNVQLVGLTRRATVMEAQVDTLEGKRRALIRYRDGLTAIAEQIATGTVTVGAAPPSPGAGAGAEETTPAMSRIVLNAQEDLRREIARAMHDGPAQSLTNIVLQAQIVERMVTKDPESARGEVRQLVAMVQQTLDATKSFIFDVRPMVLDDLGLMPTLRRAARERGRRAGIAVEFESAGADRRLPMDLESGLFRILDEAMAGYLLAAPDRVSVRLDWADDRLEGHVSASRDRTVAVDDAEREAATHASRPASGTEVPPALAAMMADRREQAEAAAEAARNAAVVSLPPQAWRDIQHRGLSAGIATELLADGGELMIGVDLPALEPVTVERA